MVSRQAHQQITAWPALHHKQSPHSFDTNLHAQVTARQVTVSQDLLTRCLLDVAKLALLP